MVHVKLDQLYATVKHKSLHSHLFLLVLSYLDCKDSTKLKRFNVYGQYIVNQYMSGRYICISLKCFLLLKFGIFFFFFFQNGIHSGHFFLFFQNFTGCLFNRSLCSCTATSLFFSTMVNSTEHCHGKRFSVSGSHAYKQVESHSL